MAIYKNTQTVLLSIFILFFATTSTLAANANFKWTANSESVSGYKIYYGTSSRNYKAVIDVGLPEIIDGKIHASVTGLQEGLTYFFASTAYSISGESGYSAEVELSLLDSEETSPGDVEYVLDDGDTGTSSQGTWTKSSSPYPYGTQSLYSKTVGGQYSYNMGATGLSQVYLWWTVSGSGGRCSNVPVKVYDGTNLLDTVYINQQQDGGVWNLIGEYDFVTGGRVTIVSASNSCSTSADAVKFTNNVSSEDGDIGTGSDSTWTTPSTDVDYILDDGGMGTDSEDTWTTSPVDVEYVLDDGDTGTSSQGTWTKSSSPYPYGTQSLYSKTVGGQYSYNMGATGLSQVYLWWTVSGSGGRCSNVPVKVYDGTNLLDTVYINQQQDGGVWNPIGEYDFVTGGRVTIMSTSSSCSTSADAVKFTNNVSSADENTATDSDSTWTTLPAGVDYVVDDGDTGTSSQGTWTKSSSPYPYGTQSLYSKTVGGQYSYDVGETGLSQVYLWWTVSGSGGRCSNVPVKVYDGTNLLDTVYINQQQDGGVWNLIGEYYFTTGGRVTIVSASSSCSTSADAVKFTNSISSPADVEYVVDDGDTGASSQGTWTKSSSPYPYGTQSLYSKTVGGQYSYNAGATGLSQVYLWWTVSGSGGRCSNVPVKVYDGTNLLDTVYINQQQDGGVWNLIGEYDFTTGGRVTIVSASSSCSTSADAVKFIMGY